VVIILVVAIVIAVLIFYLPKKGVKPIAEDWIDTAVV
jgi:hypothetical protein